jgi:hypothetical protein
MFSYKSANSLTFCIIVGVATVLSFTGCASGGGRLIETSQARLSAARLASDFSAIPPLDLKINTAQEFQIGAESTGNNADLAITFDGNEPVFVKVFRLPRWESQYSVNIASMVIGGLNDPAIFYPRYVMLDEQFKPVRRGAARDFIYRGKGAFGAISTTVFINESNRSEAYIAIMGETRGAVAEQTSVMQSAGTSAVFVPVKGGALMWFIPMGGSESPKPMRGAAGGNIELTLAAYIPKRYD